MYLLETELSCRTHHVRKWRQPEYKSVSRWWRSILSAIYPRFPT